MQIGQGFTPLKEFGDVTQQLIMPIIGIADNEIIPLGTGFVISPDGFLMTAKHVIESFTTPNPLRRNGDGYYKEYSLQVLYITSERHGENNELYLGGMIPIRNAWFSSELDIAYCWIDRPFNTEKNELLKIPSVKLSPGVPKIGENVLGFGYYQSQAVITAEMIEEKRVVDYKQKTAFTTGKIVEIHSPKEIQVCYLFHVFKLLQGLSLG